MENVKEVLKLNVEQKGALASVGELTVYLDGLTAGRPEDPAPLTNGDAAGADGDYPPPPHTHSHILSESKSTSARL